MSRELNFTIVVSAFPACGKSFCVKHDNTRYTMIDSDSSKYNWIYENGVKTDKRNPNFINDYINHIKKNIGKVDIIFVSSHADVRKALRDAGIKYILAYPDKLMKDEMLHRMRTRGNTEQFINFQTEHFDEFVQDAENEISEYCTNCDVNDIKCVPYVISKEQPYILVDRIINYVNPEFVDENGDFSEIRKLTRGFVNGCK